MINVIIALVIVAIIGAAIAYIVRAKKKGAKCIGCPGFGRVLLCQKSNGLSGHRMWLRMRR